MHLICNHSQARIQKIFPGGGGPMHKYENN